MDESIGPEQQPTGAEELPGEAVCWIGQLCPECGAMPEGAGEQDPSVPCWRCGTIRSEVTGNGTVSSADD